MADWQKKAQIRGDVVYFPNIEVSQAKSLKEVFVWDLDKTYLDTKFETIKGLFKTATEKAIEKKNVPGTKSLVLGLKSDFEIRHTEQEFAIYFITASPPQMEEKILEKLNLDGIVPFGVFCKDNLQNLKPGRLWRLTKQVGYKLQALLQMRVELGPEVKQILFGDDSESDAVIYSLYSDICARRLNSEQIRHILKGFHVVGEQMDEIMHLQGQIPKHDPVEKIYINLAADTDAEYYLKFGRRTVPSFNSLQIALDLYQDRRISKESLCNVALDMRKNFQFTSDEMERSLDDLVRRNVIGEPCVSNAVLALKEIGVLHDEFEPSIAPNQVKEEDEGIVKELEGSFEPWIPEHIDYLHDYR